MRRSLAAKEVVAVGDSLPCLYPLQLQNRKPEVSWSIMAASCLTLQFPICHRGPRGYGLAR
jgi:hypothetical protein